MAISGSITLEGRKGTFVFGINRPGGGKEDTVTITFTPKAPCTCTDIHLAQIVKATAYDRRGRKVTSDREQMYDPPRNPFPHRKGNEVLDENGDIVVIDSLACEGDPWYNGDDVAQDDKSMGSCVPQTPTTMTDPPYQPFDQIKADIHEIVKEFETCAICVETGECLGCIRWQSSSRRGTPGQASIDRPVEVSDCSLIFQLALKKFISRHAKIDPADGKLKWFCPETDNTIMGPGGETNKPYGGEIPAGLRKKYLPDLKVSIRRIAVDLELVATGRRAEPVGRVLTAAAADPGLAAVKFTWSGEQDKLRPSVVMTPILRLYPEDISPFLEPGRRFLNDFANLRVAIVSEKFLANLVGLLTRTVESTPEAGGPASVTVMAGLRTGEPIACTLALPPAAVYRAMKDGARHPDVSTDLLTEMHYIALNMGTVTGIGLFPL